MNFEDYSDDENEYVFTIVDETLPMVLLSIGGVPNVSTIVDSGVSCNVIDRQLWESLKQFKVKFVSSSPKKQLYPYGSKEPLKTAGCFTAKVAVEDVCLKSQSKRLC